MRVGVQVLNYNGMKWLPGVLSSLEANGSMKASVSCLDRDRLPKQNNQTHL